MGLNLTSQEVDAVWQAAARQCPPATSIDRLETIHTVPAELGHGYHRDIELCSGLELSIFLSQDQIATFALVGTG